MAQEVNIEEILNPHRELCAALMSRNLPKDTSQSQLMALIDQEIFNFKMLTLFQPEILECHPKTIEAAFRKTIMQNLSFERDYGLLYIMTRQTKTSKEEFKALECKPSVNGWISIYKQAGSLEDLLAPEVKLNDKGLPYEVTIGLIVPRYSNAGEITDREEKIFTFKEADFKIWQTASHKQNSTSSKPGNLKTLSLSNSNYWNYKPDQQGANDAPTPDNPGGMNPGFAITKCTGHALKRANLSKNPYAKKTLAFPVYHKYVDQDLEEHEAEWNRETQDTGKETPQFYEPQVVQESPKKEEVKMPVTQTEQNVINLLVFDVVMSEARKLATAELVETFFKERIDKLDQLTKDALRKLYLEKKNGTATPTIQQTTKITSADL